MPKSLLLGSVTEGPPVHRLRSRAGTGGREGGSAEPLCHCCHPPAGSYSLSSSSSPSSSLSQVCCWCSAPLPVSRSRDFGPVTPRQRQVTRTSNLPWLCAPSHVCALGSGCRWGRCGGGVSPRPALAWARGSAPLGSSGSGSLQPWGEPWLPAPSSQEEEEEDGMVCERPFQLLNSSSGAAGPRRGSGLGARLFMGLTDRTQLAAVVTHTPQRWPKPYTHPPASLLFWPAPPPRHWQWGWIRAEGSPRGSAHPWHRGRSSPSPPLGARWARRCLPAPAMLPLLRKPPVPVPASTWRRALAQAAAWPDRRPQLGWQEGDKRLLGGPKTSLGSTPGGSLRSPAHGLGGL